MTDQTRLNDTTTWRVTQSVDNLKEVQVDSNIISEAAPDDSLLGSVITVSVNFAKDMQIPYDTEHERKRIRNRIANLGLPKSSTTTQL